LHRNKKVLNSNRSSAKTLTATRVLVINTLSTI